ncbi:hypothetical protein MMC22_004951, partial [Lobaria immixta]|nr:hypothetical protein [Lobaria immixta]
MGFVQSKHDDALFYDTANETYVTLYVDDIKVFAPSYDRIDAVKEKLFAKYEMTDERDVKCTFEIFWHAMAWRIAPEYLTPLALTKLEKAPEGFTADSKDLNDYQTLLDELMHLM